jgi:transposase-like protein
MRKVERETEDEVQKTEARDSLARFSDELSAHRYLENVLWPQGIECPRCGSGERIGELNGASTKMGTYKCYSCRKSFSVTSGTIFSSSHVPMHKWFQAIYLTQGGTKFISARQLQQILNVSFKTAASMIARLSSAASHKPRNGDYLRKTTSTVAPEPLRGEAADKAQRFSE